MSDLSGPVPEAVFIDSPRDARIKALYDHWNALRGARAMPARSDFDPTAIPRLLPYVLLYGVSEDGGYTIRLVGEDVVQFVGRNATGSPAGATMPPRAAQMLIAILDAVTKEGAPKFRAGKAHWRPDRDHREFEACFLPFAAESGRVNTVLSGVVFPEPAA